MIKLGVIGMSYGNGHPYSWAAIFNGFDKIEMSKCRFPVIPEYLSKQNFPKDFLSDLGRVSHIWTQDINVSNQIAKASKIENVVSNIEDLCNNVDAVLLARDDAENHFQMSIPFLNSGIPIFIDKPFALSVEDANAMLLLQKFESQIFTCSALRYADELLLGRDEISRLGHITYVEGTIMNKWETYGIHILEPLVSQLPNRGKLINVKAYMKDNFHIVNVKWEKCEAMLKVTGTNKSNLAISFSGNNLTITKKFNDSFSCFRKSLSIFINSVKEKKIVIERSETLELVEILQKGRYYE